MLFAKPAAFSKIFEHTCIIMSFDRYSLYEEKTVPTNKKILLIKQIASTLPHLLLISPYVYAGMHKLLKSLKLDASREILYLIGILRCILDFERTRNQRQGSKFFSREVEFMRWFPVAFLTNDVFTVTHGGIKLTTPVL